jgi:hypothetical protein
MCVHPDWFYIDKNLNLRLNDISFSKTYFEYENNSWKVLSDNVIYLSP